MFHLRLAQTVARLSKARVSTRGTATYEYRMYGDADGPNYHIVQYLTQEMQREEVSGSNLYKMRAFATAIKAIHELDYPISTSTHVKDIPGVGEGISRRIMDFLGATRKKDFRALRTHDKEEQEKNWAMQELQQINGIGPIKARVLVEKGCMSIKQLHEEHFFKTLSKPIQASLKYERDLGARVTRPEAEAFMTSAREAIPAEFKLHLMGSYRRGKPTSSDIDILLFHPSYTTVPTFAPPDGTQSRSHHRSAQVHAHPPATLLQDSVITPLTQKGIIMSTLSGGPSRWQGLVKILESEEVVRRADIFFMPTPSEASAFLAFTGDTEFNLDCRTRAKRRGMHLNEFGLWRPRLQDGSLMQNDINNRGSDLDYGWDEGNGPDYLTQWELVETPDEAALLRELGMGYIVPERRNLSNLNLRERPTKAEEAKPSRSRVDQSSHPQMARSRASQNSTSRPPQNSRSHGSKYSAPDRERSEYQNSSAGHPRLSQTGGSRNPPARREQSPTDGSLKSPTREGHSQTGGTSKSSPRRGQSKTR